MSAAGIMNELYNIDVLLWSEEQAAKLRRLAAADRSNTDAPDWPNIIEEIAGSLLMRP